MADTLTKALMAARYGAGDNIYGQVGKAVLGNQDLLMKAAGDSTSKQLLYGLGSSLVGALLNNWAKDDAAKENAELYRTAHRFRDSDIDERASILEENPRLMEYADLLEDRERETRALAAQRRADQEASIAGALTKARADRGEVFIAGDNGIQRLDLGLGPMPDPELANFEAKENIKHQNQVDLLERQAEIDGRRQEYSLEASGGGGVTPYLDMIKEKYGTGEVSKTLDEIEKYNKDENNIRSIRNAFKEAEGLSYGASLGVGDIGTSSYKKSEAIRQDIRTYVYNLTGKQVSDLEITYQKAILPAWHDSDTDRDMKLQTLENILARERSNYPRLKTYGIPLDDISTGVATAPNDMRGLVQQPAPDTELAELEALRAKKAREAAQHSFIVDMNYGG